MTDPRDGQPDAGDPEVAEFAQAWAAAMDATALVPVAWPEVVQFLGGMTRRLADALRREEFDAAVGYRIGLDLVSAGFLTPEALGRTQTLLAVRLLPELGIDGLGNHATQARHRLGELIGAVAAGHSRATYDRALTGQETVRRAALQARFRAERAQRDAEARALRASRYDRITGVPNQVMFTDRLEEIFAQLPVTGRIGVCVIGLNAYPAITDSLGPSVGDRLVMAVAARLSWYAGEAGCPLGHLEGQDFALLMPATSCTDEAVKLTDRALAALDAAFHIDGHELLVHASAGVVESPVADTDAVEIMRAARATLHWAQRDRGSRWKLFDARRNDEQTASYKLSAAMPAALKRGQFTLAYQPLVDLTTGRVVGAEALARWDHPRLGLIVPDQFIHLAERSGMIVTLGLRLLELACQVASGWRRHTDRPPYVSVNLSAHQLRHTGLVADVAAVLHNTGLPPEQLQLEITEGTAFDTGTDTVDSLRSLTDLGIRLALDDFGTGFANHIGLKILPLHALKLDTSYAETLAGPTVEPRDHAVAANAIQLGRILDLTVTAEGIENPMQAQRLLTMGCHVGQGYLYGRPTSAEHFSQLITKP